VLVGEERHDCLASKSESPDLTSLGFFFGSSEALYGCRVWGRWSTLNEMADHCSSLNGTKTEVMELPVTMHGAHVEIHCHKPFRLTIISVFCVSQESIAF
jgi:hypothetical protein